MLPEPADPRSWDDAKGKHEGEDAKRQNSPDQDMLTERHDYVLRPVGRMPKKRS